MALPCEPASKRIIERLDEPIEAPGECRVHAGKPCILFWDWDYAEDWSGEFVRAIPHSALNDAPKITCAEFWALVRRTHGLGE